ncbi:MAG: hypothetical protein HQ472_10355 [Ignavibacteria bacterium]|nr:hypothetical protein [Ignavibacteria bacterium]
MKLFSTCHDHPSLLAEPQNPLQFYLLKQSQIDTEHILPPTYVNLRGCDNTDTSYAMEMHVEDGCHSIYKVTVGTKTMNFRDDYGPRQKEGEMDDKDINFTRNQNTMLTYLFEIGRKLYRSVLDHPKISIEE